MIRTQFSKADLDGFGADDSTLARVARDEGWEILRFERLGRRIRVAGAAGVAAAAGGLGSIALQRRSTPARRKLLRVRA